MIDYLKSLDNSFSNKLANLDSPLEKAILTLKTLLESQTVSAEQNGILQQALNYLNSSHLLAPDLLNQVKEGGVVLDKEQQVIIINYELVIQRVGARTN